MSCRNSENVLGLKDLGFRIASWSLRGGFFDHPCCFRGPSGPSAWRVKRNTGGRGRSAAPLTP